MREPIVLDHAPERRRHRSKLVVGEVNCWHGPGLPVQLAPSSTGCVIDEYLVLGTISLECGPKWPC